ncbi:ATP-binding protein [Geomesophilobacter sediminis]|uniref:histidine kinase n=1 Tax=Geomesophilobacter sediminis TaxID=2798584 RepID=A0A8J7JM45_9BACT|nr:ATP-binding protein [Geomesophilobacter sediminis]MBJ6725655.1 PAS domain S-box protein [Geomesophilobacter sediminis]
MSSSQPAAARPERTKLIFAPIRLMAILILSVFAIEMAVMIALSRMPQLSVVAANFIDATSLVTILFPILYFSVQKPLLQLLEDYRGKERELLGHREALEEKVARRTEELTAAVARLEQEAAERRKAEEALSESEDCFRRIFEQNDDGIILFSQSDGAIRDVNPAAEIIFDCDRDTCRARGVTRFCSRDGGNTLQETLDELRDHGGDLQIPRLTLALPDGTERLLSFRGKVVQLRGEKILYTTFHDITRRVRLEEEAQQMQGRLIHANRMTSLGMLVSSVAHEVNNPSNYIMLNARLLKGAWDDIAPLLEERYRETGDFPVGQSSYGEMRGILPELFDGILDGAQRISSIVENLKRFGRDDRTGSEVPVDVNEVVSLACAILNHYVARYTRNFRIEPGEGLPRVRGNRLQLEQVVMNLIANAAQALSGPQGQIRVTTSCDPGSGQVLIQVADTGCGISPEVAQRIMEPFFTTRLDQGGTGLGLAISANIVKDAGGTLDFQSVPGEGTVFTLRLAPVPETAHPNA